MTAGLSFLPAVSPDGSLLAYLASSGSDKLVIAPSAGGQPIKVFKPRGGMYQWVPGRQMLSYLSSETGVQKYLGTIALWRRAATINRLRIIRPGASVRLVA